MKFNNMVNQLMESVVKQYKINHLIVMPWNTSMRATFDDVTYPGKSPEDALAKFLYNRKAALGYTTPLGELYNQAKRFNVKVVEITPPKKEVQMNLSI
jgi:hypothetical protein